VFLEGDVVLEIQGQRVAGFTRSDIGAKLKQSLKNGNPVVIKTVPKGRNPAIFVCIFVYIRVVSQF
jgi:hypothetical protein